MKLQFTPLQYQQAAVDAVTDCFKGQPYEKPFSYTVDPGRRGLDDSKLLDTLDLEGFRNNPFKLSESEILKNIRAVQARQNLPISQKLASDKISRVNLDIEMETGTGKTFCYIKTIFELYQLYGWSKFIIVVPSVAIREGVYKSFQITAGHFHTLYGRQARCFIYNSTAPHNIESFASDAGINVMIINIQAFNAKGAANRRIYEVLDDFQSRRPIDIIAATHPILILDEPQKMEGGKTLDSLEAFRPLMALRYSATHRTSRDLIHRLDAVDAYNQKLVKKIAVRGITVKGLAGTASYLYLEDIEISRAAPIARLEMEILLKTGLIKRQVRKVKKGDNLYDLSNGLNQYVGQVVSEIDAVRGVVEFTTGLILACGEAYGNVNEATLRRLQIREAIRAHLAKEKHLYPQGIKVLSLFFIDEVAKYRDYGREDEKGDYARIFEEEYAAERERILEHLDFEGPAYRQYLGRDAAKQVHSGYFSIDKQKRMANPIVTKRGEEQGQSTNASDYDLILKDKERLLSLDEPVRFIFSHSALREGWDNPNVFVMGMLKHSDNTISRRQEVGRGLRLAVNQNGARQDHPAIVHDINVLTVVANESYRDFVDGLQREISDSLSARPRKADRDFFLGKIILDASGQKVEINPPTAKKICRYLDDNGYVDDYDQITPEYRTARAEKRTAQLPFDLADLGENLFLLIDSVYDDSLLPKPENDRGPKAIPLNENFTKREFQALWGRINRKAVYKVDFDSAELTRNCVRALDTELQVAPLTYIVHSGMQADQLSDESLKSGRGFDLQETATKTDYSPAHSKVPYDLLGRLTESTQLTRRTVANILIQVKPQAFAQFKRNPEHFISEASRLINEQKATTIVERLSYDPINDYYDQNIFAVDKLSLDTAEAAPARHIRDYVQVDSETERRFVQALNTGVEVVVYAKLPRGFFIPTPVGDYHPDWAIVFDEAQVRHIYFVAETKGDLSTLELRPIEQMKTECARKFFDRLNRELAPKLDRDRVIYNVVDSYGKLMKLVRPTGIPEASLINNSTTELDVTELQYYSTEFECEARTTVAFHLIANLIAHKPGLPEKTYCNWAVWATSFEISANLLNMTEVTAFKSALISNRLPITGWPRHKVDQIKIFKLLARSGLDIKNNVCLPKPDFSFSWPFPYIDILANFLEQIDDNYSRLLQQYEAQGSQEEKKDEAVSLPVVQQSSWAQANNELQSALLN